MSALLIPDKSEAVFTFVALESRFLTAYNYDFSDPGVIDSDFKQFELNRVDFSGDPATALWSTLQLSSISSPEEIYELSTSLLALDTNLEVLVSFATTDGSSFLGEEHVQFNDDMLAVQANKLT